MARVAIVLADDFTDAEVATALQRVADAGHESTGDGGVALAAHHDGLVPGGRSVDRLRGDDRIVSLCKHMAMADKPVALAGHGSLLLSGTSMLDGRSVTSDPLDRSDLEGAGATWVDAPVVEDGNLLSARDASDVAPLCDALLDRLA